MKYVELNEKDHRLFKAIYKAFSLRNSKSEKKKKLYDLTIEMFPFLQGTGGSYTKYNERLRNFFSEITLQKQGIVIYREGIVPAFYLSKDSSNYSLDKVRHIYNTEKGKIR